MHASYVGTRAVREERHNQLFLSLHFSLDASSLEDRFHWFNGQLLRPHIALHCIAQQYSVVEVNEQRIGRGSIKRQGSSGI